jgi:hypothetical protein
MHDIEKTFDYQVNQKLTFCIFLLFRTTQLFLIINMYISEIAAAAYRRMFFRRWKIFILFFIVTVILYLMTFQPGILCHILGMKWIMVYIESQANLTSLSVGKSAALPNITKSINRTILANAIPVASLPVVYLDKDIKHFEGAVRANVTKIPRIIHQTWKTHNVPIEFAEYAKTWLKQNPDWEYWFWTDKDAETFIKSKYPKYYDMYMKYPQAIHRADAMRYFILYEFGGWYADLDIEDLKPLDHLGKKHNCIISQEPWGHVLFIWNRLRLACNALMAARPKHPYFKYVIEQLPKNAPKKNVGPMATTGPIMIDNTLYQYEKIVKKAKIFNNSDTVYLANPDYFLPILSGNGLPPVKKACARRQDNALKKRICDRLNKEKWANRPPPEAYTNHVWIHTYYHPDLGKKKYKNIFQLVPKTVNVSTIFMRMSRNSTG